MADSKSLMVANDQLDSFYGNLKEEKNGQAGQEIENEAPFGSRLILSWPALSDLDFFSITIQSFVRIKGKSFRKW